MVVVTGLLLIVCTAMMSVFAGVQRSTLRQTARSESTDDVRLAMERLTKEIRQTALVRSGTASTLDVDTYLNGVLTRVRYAASGTILTRTSGSGSALTLLSRLTSTSIFTYAPDAIRPSVIAVALQVRPLHFGSDNARVSLSSEVELRNRSSS